MIYKIEPNQERYIDHLFDLDTIYHQIVPLSEQYNKYFSEDTYDANLKNKYDISNDPYLQVKTHDELVEYYIQFITQQGFFKYGIRGHTGPLSKETYLIREELLNFYDKNIITFDSEPGLVSTYNSFTTVQKPYVFLLVRKDMLYDLYEFVASHDMISCIDYDAKQQMVQLKNDFPNVSDLDDYTFEFFGIRDPTKEEISNPALLESYFEWIFSDQFFTELSDFF